MEQRKHLTTLKILFGLTLLPFCHLLLAIMIELSGQGVEGMIRNGFYLSAFWGIPTSIGLLICSSCFPCYKFAFVGAGMTAFNIGLVWFEYQVLLGYAC